MHTVSTDNGRSGKGLLFVISSVSGGGKTTVINRIVEVVEGLAISVSHTTRKPRRGEVDGRDYHFVPAERFEEMVAEDLFLEWANVYGHSYGTARETVSGIVREGGDALLDIDVQGALQVKRRSEDAVLIFLVPPSEEEQRRRLEIRGTEDDHDISTRLEAARQELAFIREYHYSVLNDELEEAVEAVRCIIVAERCRQRRHAGKLQEEKN